MYSPRSDRVSHTVSCTTMRRTKFEQSLKSAKKAAPPAPKKKREKASVITRALDWAENILNHPLFPLDPLVKAWVGPARAGIKRVTGFDERLASPGTGTVQTMDAPVAFARNAGMKPNLRYLAKGDTGALVHVHDMFLNGPIPKIATGGYNLQFQPFNPQETAIFPNYASEFGIWEKYRVHGIRLHFVHFAPTSYQTAVELGFTQEQIGATGVPTPTSSSEAMAYEDVVMGSCYEDFGLDVGRDTLAQVQGNGNFLWNSVVVTSLMAGRQQNCGVLFYVTDNGLNDGLTTDIGYIFTEAIIEFVGMKSDQFQGVGSRLRWLGEFALTEEATEELLDRAVERVAQEVRSRLTIMRAQKPRSLAGDKFLLELQSPPQPAASAAAGLPSSRVVQKR